MTETPPSQPRASVAAPESSPPQQTSPRKSQGKQTPPAVQLEPNPDARDEQEKAAINTPFEETNVLPEERSR